METLYSRVLENLVLPAGDKLLQTNVMAALSEYRRIQRLPSPELDALQSERLRSLLQFAVQHVPFYSHLSFDASQDPKIELKKFPLMQKPLLKANLDRLVVGDKDRLIRNVSSGSSGIQSEVYCSDKEQSEERAIQLLWWEWAGYKLGAPIVQTGMTTQRGVVKGIKDVLFRTSYFPAFHLTADDLLKKLREIREQSGRIRHLMGYASSLYLFAQTAEQHGVDDVRFDSVVSWGDKMFPHYRSLIERQFRTKVFDTYGCAEGCMIAAQCESSSYHVMSPHVYLEILDENGEACAPGARGKVVVTRLDNYSMPLIRYCLGDLAALEPSQTPCPCGRALPLLGSLIGRDTDIVRTRSGKQMIVHFFTGIFEFYPEIRQFRIVQRTLDAIEVEYIPDAGFTVQATDRIRQQIQAHLREEFRVTFREVSQIPATASGKPQVVLSLLPDKLSGSTESRSAVEA